MAKIPLFTSDWRRDSAKEATLKVQNRFFEQNPNNQVDGVAMITRPGYHKYLNLSNASGETVSNTFQFYYQEGLFSGDCFSVGADAVCRITNVPVVAKLDTFTGDPFSSAVPYSNQGCFTSGIGAIPGNFFVTDGGQNIFVIPTVEFDTGVLSITGAVSDGAVVRIGDVYYQFTTGSVDAGTPSGTAANPWLINGGLGGPVTALQSAINALGTAGQTYSTALEKHPTVNAESNDPSHLSVYSFAENRGDPFGTVTTFTGTGASWSSGYLTGGGGRSTTLYKIPLPFGSYGYNITAIASFYSYLMIAVNDNQNPGRFYWLQPGAFFLDPLDFATAESSPDGIVSMRAVNERLFFLGNDTVETWYFTGDGQAPFARVQGGVFDIGSVAGTDTAINDALFFVSPQGVLYQFSGSTYNVVSSPAFSNRVREFIANPPPGGDFETYFRSWECQAEGHLFYILNLGFAETLVYDLATQQFSMWGNDADTNLDQHGGTLWINRYIVGDVASDAVWILDPDYQVDDDKSVESTTESPIQNTFLAVVTGGVPARMRETIKCNEVYLTASLGWPRPFDLYVLTDEPLVRVLYDEDGSILIEWGDGSLAGVTNAPYVTLETSDDNGVTWKERGSIFIVSEDWNQELVWRSLGAIGKPGRLFRISDYSALPRIDGLDIR